MPTLYHREGTRFSEYINAEMRGSYSKNHGIIRIFGNQSATHEFKSIFANAVYGSDEIRESKIKIKKKPSRIPSPSPIVTEFPMSAAPPATILCILALGEQLCKDIVENGVAARRASEFVARTPEQSFFEQRFDFSADVR